MANNPRSARRDRSDDPPPPSDETKGGDQKSEFKKPSFWVTVATLLVIGGYTYFAHQQVTETQTANTIAKKALTEANKPYVMYTGIAPNFTTDANGEHFRVGFTVTNLGNTPANFLRYTNCDPIILNSVAVPNIHCNASEKSSDPMVLGPKQATTWAGSIILPADLEATRDDKKNIYIFGYVTYEDSIDSDAYGNPEQRETRFCQKISQITAKAIPAPTPTVPPTSSPEQSPQTAPVPTPNIAPAANPAPQTLQFPPGFNPIATLGCPTFNCMDSGCSAQR
jgi:hypothetical protein